MYKAIYREYRPKTFEEILGQEHITTTLKNQIKNDNTGHAYLFSGTHGTGKTSAAKIFSRAVNCLDPRDGEPCNQCKNCLEILAETTVDVVEMDAASNNSVDDIRELREKVVYPPTNIVKKVYIIDEVHMLSRSAFNALLKTLEEPPRHILFILATTEPERLPQTILSRCQRFDFKRISTEDIIKNMKFIVEDLGKEIDEDALTLIARNSEGAMRDALSLLDQCISFSDEKITYEVALDLLGITNKDIVFELVDSTIEGSLEKALNSLDEISRSGKDMETLTGDLVSHFRNLMVAKSSSDPGAILNIDNIEAFQEQSGKVSIEFILKALNILIEAASKGKWSGEARLVLEMSIINMVGIEQELSLLERVERLEEGYVEKPSIESKAQRTAESQGPNRPAGARPQVQSEKPESKAPSTSNNVQKTPKPKESLPKEAEEGKESFKDLDLETIKRHWDVILKDIKSDKISLYALIREGKLTEFENNQIQVNYSEEFGFHHSAISKEDNKKFIEEVVSKYFGIDIAISFSLGSIAAEPKKEDNIDDEIEKAKGIFGEDIVELN